MFRSCKYVVNYHYVTLLYSERCIICTVTGGNFCAGYDLNELAGFDSTNALPNEEQLDAGRGPMVMY